MKNLLFIPALFVILLSNLFAQGGSSYSYYGIGEILHDYSIKRAALGNLATGYSDDFDLNSYNPAAWTSIRNVYLTAGMSYSYNRITDNQQKADFNNFYFDNVKVGLPIYTPYGIALTFSISPYSKVNYNIIENKVFEQTPYKVNYKGYGGVNKFSVGSSFISPLGCSYGISLNYFNGTIDYESDIDVFDRNTYEYSFTREKSLNGIGVTFGYISPELTKFIDINNLTSLKFAFVVNSGSKFNTEEMVLKSTFVTDTISSIKYKTEIPWSFGAGLSATLSNRYNFFLDFFQQNWTNYKANGLKDTRLNNSFLLSAGLEISPVQKPEKFTETFTYRFGAFYKQSEFIVNQKNINEYGISTGMTVPFDARNGIDFAIQYSIRGTKENSLQRENVLRFNIGISFSDIWFLREE